MTGRLRAALAGAAVVAAAAGLWSMLAARADGGLRFATVRRGDLVVGVEVTGALRAVESSSLGPPQVPEIWDFKIAELAPEGREVEAGDPILAFDTTELSQQLDRQTAEADGARKQIEKTERSLRLAEGQDRLALAEAEARLRKARNKVDRPEELLGAQELRAARLDLELAELEVAHLKARTDAARRSAEAQLGALRSQLARALANVAGIEEAIESMTILAPRDGTIIYVENWRGEKSKVGDNVWRGMNIVELPDLTRMEGDGRVAEADAGRVAEGQRVTLRLDAHPDVEFAGRVASIWRTVERESWRSPLKVVRLVVALDETDPRRMRPGMRLRGRIEVERASGALLLPADAILRGSDGSFVERKGLLGLERVAVDLGRRSGGDVEVLAGLAEGDVVAVVGEPAAAGGGGA